TSHTYTAHVDTGLQPSATVPGLTVGQTYYFAVTAVDSTGKESPFSNEVSITVGAAVMPPVANFSTNTTSGTAPLAVTFTDTSTSTPTSWAWTFGDGTTSSARSRTLSSTARAPHLAHPLSLHAALPIHRRQHLLLCRHRRG